MWGMRRMRCMVPELAEGLSLPMSEESEECGEFGELYQ